MEHNLLTLDFWQDSVTYEGTTMPTGMLGCEVLNISDGTINRLTNLCAPLNSFMGTLNTMKPDLSLLTAAKDSAIEIINLLSDVPPFSRLDHTFYSKWIEKTFVPEAVQECLMSSMALMSGGLTSEQQEQYKRGLRLARLLPVFANLGFSLGEYKKTMTDFAVKMDAPDSDRSPDGLAELFGKQFNAFHGNDAGTVFGNTILKNIGLSPEYYYSNNTNTYLLRIKKHTLSPVVRLIISLLCAFTLGFAGKALFPESVMNGILNNVINPLHDTFMSLLSCIAGPMIFLSVAWGMYGIGDAATLKKTGKKLLKGYMGGTLLLAAGGSILSILMFAPNFSDSSGFTSSNAISPFRSGISFLMSPENFSTETF